MTVANFESQIDTLLSSVSALTTIATGGIYTFTELGFTGLNRTKIPGAFTSGIIKPTILIKARSANPTGNIVGDLGQSVKQVIELWLYEYQGYTNIDSMEDLIYANLQLHSLTGGQLYWEGEVRGQRDNSLDANVLRIDYAVYFIKG